MKIVKDDEAFEAEMKKCTDYYREGRDQVWAYTVTFGGDHGEKFITLDYIRERGVDTWNAYFWTDVFEELFFKWSDPTIEAAERAFIEATINEFKLIYFKNKLEETFTFTDDIGKKVVLTPDNYKEIFKIN